MTDLPLVTPIHSIDIDGGDLRFRCEAGDPLLRAGLRGGLGLPYECNAGACGSCKFELLEGEVHDLYPEAPGIKQRDRDRGRLLACQTVALSDCRIRVRLQESFAPRDLPRRMHAELVEVRDMTHDIREFTVRSNEPARFRAGQYAMLSVAGGEQRAYSMSNVANDDRIWQFMIRRMPGGVVSGAMFGLRPGQTLAIDGPYGIAYFREESHRPIVCIAGGSGIAPMRSILCAASAVHDVARDAWLFFGGRGPADVPRVQELFAHQHGTVKWHPAVSVPALAEGTDWLGEFGFVHELLPRNVPGDLRGYEYYLAGPPAMIEATIRLLVAEHKVSQQQLHFDRFF